MAEIKRTTERFIIRGSDESGEFTVNLESLYDGDDPAERIRVWSNPLMGAYHHDVHIAKETVTTTYERVELPTKE